MLLIWKACNFKPEVQDLAFTKCITSTNNGLKTVFLRGCLVVHKEFLKQRQAL